MLINIDTSGRQRGLLGGATQKKSEVIISGRREYWKLAGGFASYSDTHHFHQFLVFSSFFWTRTPPSSGKLVSYT